MKKILIASLLLVSFKSYAQKADNKTLAFIKSVEKAVLTDDRLFISSNVSYPITVILDKKRVPIKDRASFLKVYDKIINRNVKLGVYNGIPFENDRVKGSFMLGAGTVWIDDTVSNGKGNIISAINN